MSTLGKPLRRLAQIGLGLAVGLSLAEGAFRLRDHGAFPHVNFYIEDSSCGVRLEPGATETLAFGGNPATSLRVNAEGYRGADWPAPSADEIAIVGDSQVFGLGVEEDQTLSAALERELGGPRVLNAGVPTYGPREYDQVMWDLLRTRHPKTIVYVVNLVNDAEEAGSPNSTRHVVWDGWAVRRSSAPTSYLDFPGRELLYQRSHAVFALRQWLYFRGAGRVRPDEHRSLSSEENDELAQADYAALLRAAEELGKAKVEAKAERERSAFSYDSSVRAARLSALSADLHVKLLAYKTLKLGAAENGVYLASNAIPGDIVVPQRGEEGAPLGASVKFVTDAQKLRTRIEKDLRERALADKSTAESKEILSSIEERDELEKRLRRLHADPIYFARATSPLVDSIAEAQRTAATQGAKLVVLVLPMDVMVSADEWKKYDERPVDLTEARAYVEDLVSAARDAGAIAVDATPALVAAEPGAFLNHDPHLTAKGHAAVAKLLAAELRSPSRPAKPEPIASLEEGRSRVPAPSDWGLVGDYLVRGSDAAGCVTKRIREWVYVRCDPRSERASRPTNVRVLEGGFGEAIALSNEGRVTLVAPIVRGTDLVARFSWTDASKRLVIRWPSDVIEPDASLEKDDGPPDADPKLDLAKLCACQSSKPHGTCESLLASPREDCSATFADDCASLLACSRGDPFHMPTCGPGLVNAGAELWCYAPCDEKGACTKGHCVDRRGAKLCVEP